MARLVEAFVGEEFEFRRIFHPHLRCDALLEIRGVGAQRLEHRFLILAQQGLHEHRRVPEVGRHAHFGDAHRVRREQVVIHVAAREDFAEQMSPLLADAPNPDRRSLVLFGFLTFPFSSDLPFDATLFWRYAVLVRSALSTDSSSLTSKGFTNTVACLRSGDMRTSVMLTGCVASRSSCTSPRARISLSRWRTCSPTRSTRTDGPLSFSAFFTSPSLLRPVSRRCARSSACYARCPCSPSAFR